MPFQKKGFISLEADGHKKKKTFLEDDFPGHSQLPALSRWRHVSWELSHVLSG